MRCWEAEIPENAMSKADKTKNLRMRPIMKTLCRTRESFLSKRKRFSRASPHLVSEMICRCAKRQAVAVLGLIYGCAASAGETPYTIQTVAGSSLVGDGGSALNAQLSDAQCLALDRWGN